MWGVRTGIFVQLPALTGYPSTITMLEHTAAGPFDLGHFLNLDLVDCRGVVFGRAYEPLFAEVVVISIHHATFARPTWSSDEVFEMNSYARWHTFAGEEMAARLEIVNLELVSDVDQDEGAIKYMSALIYLVRLCSSNCRILTNVAHFRPQDLGTQPGMKRASKGMLTARWGRVLCPAE